MRVPHFLSFALGLSAMLAFFGCSRESSVKENVNLKNNHSRVFAFDKPIPETFIDSLTNAPVNEADSIPDTLTVTVNDTVYLIGVLPYFQDKISRFQWTLTKKDGKDTNIIGGNGKLQTWAYANAGLYEPKFIVMDYNNATDTAGTATRKAWIKVIDTKPVLVVPKDTLWTKHDGDITFPILASDSFGTITSIKVDLDASGKDSATVWKYEKSEDTDSLYITIKNKDAKIDSLGNQKIYVIVTDDDDNVTKDSVYLHFNRIPRLKVIYPQDGARHNIDDRFYFYYEGEDDDNPQDLKYYIYAQEGKNGQPPQKAFTDDDLIAKAFTSNIFEPIDKNGKNVITLVNSGKQLTDRIYWDMYVTDGYDVVRLTRISTGENTSRPWTFYIGNLKSTQGKFTGVAKYQDRDNHAGIHIEFSNGNKTFDAVTKADGNYTVEVDAGRYTASASSELKEYNHFKLDSLFVEEGGTNRMSEIVLKDTVAPYLIVKNIDTLTTRSFTQSVYARDLGSKLDTVTASIDGKAESLNCNKTDTNSVFNCPLNLNNLVDGNHKLVYSAKDKAGNTTKLEQTITVMATKIALDVNGLKNDRIGEGDKLTFTATISDAIPAPKKTIWSWSVDDTKKTVDVDENGRATITYTYEQLKNLLTAGSEYVMTASYTENGANVKAQVKFGIRGDNPTIFFTEPAFDDTVSLNDAVTFKVKTYEGKSTTSMTVKWSCPNSDKLSSGYVCPANDTKEASIAYKAVGTYTITAIVTDQDGKADTTSTKIIVISDPPSIKVSTESNTNEYKIHSIINIKASASDKFGTIQKIEWGCSNGTPAYDNSKEFETPGSSVSDVPLQIILPGTEQKNLPCYFRVTDDDGEHGDTTLYFTTLLDPPTVRLATKKDTVKINSIQKIKAIATDKLGYIAEYAYACSENKSDLANPDWSLMSGPETEVRMPSTATKAYYCVVQVKDDDGNTAKDTAEYTILLGLPTVTAYANYTRVTIKDAVELNAHAQDSLGSLVKYEWGCAGKEATSIAFSYSSTTTPRTTMTMPADAQDGYRCIVRVTDDDGNTAKDTVTIDIIQAPPTITVPNDTLKVRPNFNIALSATATDDNKVPSDPGEIVKREWSCGSFEMVERNWKTVSSFDTVWKAPEVQQLICIAQATDNDGNTARDTITINYTTNIPMLWVKTDSLYVNPGDEFTLDATVNDAWQGIDWFSWDCFDAATGKTMEKESIRYSYAENHGTLAITKESSYSEQGKDMYCVISAQETSGKDVLKDTTKVKILKQHPRGVITAADTVYLWSGDESVDNEALYFYTPEWGGFHSVPGELGDKNAQDFWWRFSNVSANFYQGRKDGTIDTVISEFNTAFIRSTREGSMTIYLDYRDSSTKTPPSGFYSRHRAPEVSHKVYFSKAWRNQGPDTVITQTTSSIAPSLAILGTIPMIAYANDESKVTLAWFNDTTWKSLGSVNAAAKIKKIESVTLGNDFYFCILDVNGNLTVYKSTAGTSAPAKMGSVIDSIQDVKLVGKASESTPHAVLIRGNSRLIYMYDYNGSAWTKNTNFDKLDKDNQTFNTVDATYTDNGELVVIGVSSTYIAYYGFFDKKDYKPIARDGFRAKDVGLAKIVSIGSKVYMLFNSRDVNNYGPRLAIGDLESTRIKWPKESEDKLASSAVDEGIFANNIALVASNGELYAAFDNRAIISQVDVYRYDGSKWHLHGENQLPYFEKVFYDINKYNLRGLYPGLAVDKNKKIYLSMLAHESSTGPGRNNGPLVMKYVADNWKVHDN